jgi:hypothetical protein
MIVGLSGYAGSGKDTAGEALIERGFVRLAFADEVKKALLILDPHIPSADAAPVRVSDHLFKKCGGDWNLAKQHPEIRRLLNAMGTDLGRNFIDEDVWVKRVGDQILTAMRAERAEDKRNFVITDARFPNEAARINAWGGVMWRIERPGNRPASDAAGIPYKSETALNNYEFDLVITNHGSIEDLHRAVLLALEAER